GRFEGLLGYASQGALESSQPLVLLALAFGLSTDYGVFLLSRIKEAHDGGLPSSEAVAVGLERTGRIVTAAALLFCTAMAAFATSRIIFIKELGLGTAAAVLIDATIVRALLLPQTMHRPLAQALAERGNRVITLDLLGHGESDHPRDMWRYSMPLFGEQAVALLEHLEIDDAIIGGTSLGANVTLEAAALAPERIRGLVIEMPVLDNALLGCALAFTPMLVMLTFGAPLTRLVSRVAARVPRGLTHLTDVGLDWISQDPGPSAAVLQGLFFGRTAPPRSERSRIETRALVIGHGRDPVHPFSDSDMLVRELRNGRLI